MKSKTKTRPAASAKAAQPTAEEKSRWNKRKAGYVLQPAIHAAVSISEYGKTFGEQDFTHLVDELRKASKEVADGDLGRLEAMLVTQAYSLQAIFTNLSRRANIADNMGNLQIFMNLALKTQAQCRSTLEALVEIKYPRPPTFVRQQNIGYQQQVNNQGSGSGVTTDVGAPARAGKNEKQPNELLEEKPHERLDTRTTSPTIQADPPLETMERRNRAEI